MFCLGLGQPGVLGGGLGGTGMGMGTGLGTGLGGTSFGTGLGTTGLGTGLGTTGLGTGLGTTGLGTGLSTTGLGTGLGTTGYGTTGLGTGLGATGLGRGTGLGTTGLGTNLGGGLGTGLSTGLGGPKIGGGGPLGGLSLAGAQKGKPIHVHEQTHQLCFLFKGSTQGIFSQSTVLTQSSNQQLINAQLMLSAITMPALFGDERDVIIKKFNQLGAYCGSGRGLTSLGGQPQLVQFTSDNPFARFKVRYVIF